ncbi:hypothetical protein F5Y01DRAFT_319880 [Xylaria sp. FL0043]|nr:hypothetical protein F5Y01DRAFT_319880 [Xylaria sp. FL0043]
MNQISNSTTIDTRLESEIPFSAWHSDRRPYSDEYEDPCKHGLWTECRFLDKGVCSLIDLADSMCYGCRACGLIFRAVDFMLPHGINNKSNDVSIRAYCPGYPDSITFQVLQKGRHTGAFQLFRKPREEPLYPVVEPDARLNERKPTLKYSMDIISDTRTSEAFDRAMKWLSHCRANCTGCNRERDSSFMPKRLLNVGCNRTGDAPDRVFLFDAVSPAPYAHGSGIPISALPQTIQDAVTVCRGINIQNLWVDSLCIVQDDGDDWSQEAGRMFDVYLNSELTIYAKQSSNCNLGFLGPQTYGSSGWQRSLGTIVAPKFIDSTDELLLRTGELDYDTRRYPLDTRGWSLQELIAPNRRLIFTGREMIWSCNGYRVSETMTESDLPYRGAYELHQFKSKLCVDQVDESEKEFPLRAWEELIGEYSQRSLSRETDKLSALSSLAQLASGSQVGIPGFYVAGLWRENFIPGLAWSLHRNGSEHRRQCQYRAPTWSWASVDGPIRYDYRKYANMWGTLVAQNIDARVENVKCEPMSHYDMTGSIAWAQADLIGMLAPVNMIRLTKAVAADHLDDRYLVQGLSGDRFRVDIDFGADLCWRQLARSADICDIEDIRVPEDFRVECYESLLQFKGNMRE